MKNVFKWMWSIIVLIVGMFAIGNAKKNKEVKQLKTAIKSTKKEEIKIENSITELEEDKIDNKVEITRLKRKLAKTKKEIGGMDKAYTENNVDEAVKFLRKFAAK